MRATGALAGVPSRQPSAFLSSSSTPFQVVLRPSLVVCFQSCLGACCSVDRGATGVDGLVSWLLPSGKSELFSANRN